MATTRVLIILMGLAVPHILASTTFTRQRAGLTEFPIEDMHNATTHVYLQYNEITEIKANTFNGFGQLIHIDLSYNRISVVSDSAFNGTPLVTLNINFNRLTTLPQLDAVGSTLANFDATNNQIERWESDDLRHLTSLTRLNLIHNKLTSVAPDVLTDNSPLMRLLYLGNNRLTDIDFIRSPNIPFSNNIYHLYLDSSYVGQLPPNAFERLTKVNILRMVATGLTEIPDLINQRLSLKYLYLSWNFITVIRKDAFDGFNLVRLDLDNNRLVDVSYLFHPLISITTLYLNDNNIGPIDISHIDRPITGLTSLYLQNNNLGAMPCGDMMRFLELVLSLTNLNLQSTGLETFPDISMLNHRLIRLYLLNPRTMRCDCSLAWMRNITQMVTITDIAPTSRPCGSPGRLLGLEWSQVMEEELCGGDDVPSCGRSHGAFSRPIFTTEHMTSISHTANQTVSDSTWLAAISGVLGLLLLAMIVVVIVILVRRKSPAAQGEVGKVQEAGTNVSHLTLNPGYTELQRRHASSSSTYDEIHAPRNT